MAVPPDNQGGETPIDSASRWRSGARGTNSPLGTGQELDPLMRSVDRLRSKLDGLLGVVKNVRQEIRGMGMAGEGGTAVPQSAVGRSMASSMSGLTTRVAAAVGGGGGGAGGGIAGAVAAGGAGGRGSVALSMGMDLASRIMPAIDARIGRGAEASLQKDRMTTQLMQMYGMTHSQVFNQMRIPLAGHMLLGGSTSVNDLLGLQASTGLSALGQASSVEAIRAISGFSYGSADVTRMLSTMASPEVANRMFMMGGTGMYGIGGTQRSGMQVIQDLVRRSGLTNPEALKGALQPGSNTRQRLTAMGVPQDMQDMVIQYAMQNTQYQRKTGTSAMYDPSLEGDRRTMGIEGTYIVQHEKTTGARNLREERFYGRQADNFANFEKNLRTVTNLFANLEDVLSGIIGLGISTKGHPITQTAAFVGGSLLNQASSMVPGGDAVSMSYSPMRLGGDASTETSEENRGRLSQNNEAKLAQLDPRLAVPLRRMLADNPRLSIGDAKRSSAQQERSFRQRYRPRPDLKEKTKPADRIWNGVVWEHIAGPDVPAMAPPGGSWHEKGLAADVNGDDGWIIANAAKYGLGHGGTGTGGPDDEPFHIQPKSLMGKTPDNRGEVATGTKSSAGAASAMMPTQTGLATGAPSAVSGSMASTASFTNAAAIASAVAAQGVSKSVSSIIAGIDRPPIMKNYGKPMGGDATAGPSSVSGGGMVFNISPTITINGSGSGTEDLKRAAKEIGKMIEHEARLAMLRSS